MSAISEIMKYYNSNCDAFGFAIVLASLYIDLIKQCTNRGYYAALKVPPFAQRRKSESSKWNRIIIIVIFLLILLLKSNIFVLGTPYGEIGEVNEQHIFIDNSQLCELIISVNMVVWLIVNFLYRNSDRLIKVPLVQNICSGIVILVVFAGMYYFIGYGNQIDVVFWCIVFLVLFFLPMICYFFEVTVYGRFLRFCEADFEITIIGEKTYLIIETVSEGMYLVEVVKKCKKEMKFYQGDCEFAVFYHGNAAVSISHETGYLFIHH